MADIARAAAAVAALKRLAPTSLVVECTDTDTPRKVAIKKSRNKWQALTATLAEFEWLRIEALDGAGQVLGVVGEDEGDEGDEGGSASSSELRALLALMLKAQDVALERQGKYTEGLLNSSNRLLQTMTERVVSLEGFAHQMLQQQQLAAQQNAAGGGDEFGGFGPEISKAIAAELAGKVGPMAMAAMAGAAKPAAPKPKPGNGAP